MKENVEQIFSLGQFKDIQVDTNEMKDGVEIVFIVEEIPSVGGVKLVGNGSIESTEIHKNISLKRGATYKSSKCAVCCTSEYYVSTDRCVNCTRHYAFNYSRKIGFGTLISKRKIK